MRLLYFLLAISSILVIGCSGNDIIDEAVASPTPTLTKPAETTVQPNSYPVISPSPTASFTITALPTEESTKEIWQEYVNEEYDFSFRYPNAWTLVELDNRPNQASLVYKGTGIALRIRFRHSDEVVDLQQYGGAAGDFESRGTIIFLGEAVEKTVLVYQGLDKQIHYNQTSEIGRGDLFFTLAVESNSFSEQAVIPEEIQTAADEVLATFKLLGE
jgi:hypothetical protein